MELRAKQSWVFLMGEVHLVFVTWIAWLVRSLIGMQKFKLKVLD